MSQRNRRWLKLIFAAVAVAFAAILVYRIFSHYELENVASALRSVPAWRIGGTLAFAAASYFCLSLFDWLGTRYAGKPQPYRRCLLTSFCSLSLGHNIGFAALSSGTVRYRFYSRYGLSFGEVMRVVLFCGLTVGLGMMITGGIALIVQPDLAEAVVGIRPAQARVAGGGLLALGLLYLLLCVTVRGTVRIRRWTVALPRIGLAVPQVAVGAVNFLCVAACLHQAVLALADVSYFKVAAGFVMGNTAALITHVPGGLGIIESVVLLLIPDSGVLAALVLFRFCYYLVPLALGGALFAACEITWRRGSVGSRQTSSA